MYQHGSYTKEVPSSIRGMITAKNPIFVVGTAPINMGDLENVNKAQLVTTPEEAMKFFGGTGDLNFTISEVLDACFNIHNVRPIIVVNVLDPKVHKAAKEETNLAIVEKQLVISTKGILLSSLKLKIAGQADLIPSENYYPYFKNTGEVVVEIKTDGIQRVDIEYEYLDPSRVTNLEIIGGIDPNTLERKGFECIDEVFMKYSMIPGLLIAPGYSHIPEVKAIIDSKAGAINSKYGAMGIIDLPEETEYGDAILKKKELNIVDEDLILCYGKGKLGDKIYHMSTLTAALMGSVTASNDGVPYESPSNKNLKVNALVIKTNQGYKEILLDEEQQANLLNENGIVTAIRRSNGFVLWGNRTAIYQPGGSTDPKDIWIPGKMMFKFIANSLILNTAQDVDKPMNYSRAELIQNTTNTFLAGLVSSQKLLGGRIEFKREENSIGDMLEGKFKWHIYIGVVIPGESLHFILEYDPSYQQVFVEKMAA